MKNQLRILILITFSFLINTLFAEIPILTKYEVEIPVPNIIKIKGCINWHVDFTRLKSTVFYNDRLISMGKYGGFVCINPESFTIDKDFTKKLNSDIFTNVIVRNDTLIAEKFGELFYLSKDTTWINYYQNDPVLLFKIAFEDSDYVFFTEDGGEYGGALFVFNKNTKNTQIIISNQFSPNAILKVNNEYIVSSSLKTGYWFSPHYKIPIEKLESQNIDSVILDYQTVGKYWYNYPNQLTTPKQNKYEHIKNTELYKNQYSNIFITSKYSNNVTECYNNTFIDIWLKNNHSTDNFSSKEEEGLILIKGDTIVKVNLIMNPTYEITVHHDMDSPHFDEIPYVNIFGAENDTIYISPEEIISEQINWDNNSVKSRQIDFKISPQVSIESFINDKTRNVIINDNQKKCYLPFNDSNIALRYCFRKNENDYLYFFTLGNENHRYGLIEITDFDKFMDKYCLNK